jgi:hypothetical protein
MTLPSLSTIVGYLLALGLLPLLLAELVELGPWLAVQLIKYAVQRLPEDNRQRYEEELLAIVEGSPGKLFPLLRAISLALNIPILARILRDQPTHPLVRVEGFGLLAGFIVSLLTHIPVPPVTLFASKRLVRLAAFLVPSALRPRYFREWPAELEQLRHSRSALLTTALRILIHAPSTGRSWRGLPSRSYVLRWLRRFEPVLVGLLAALIVLFTFLSSLPGGQGADRHQLAWATLAALLTGVFVGYQWRRDHPYNPDEDDLEIDPNDDDHD